MLLPDFDYHDPVSLHEALALKKNHGKNARILAGGTDLLVHLKKKLVIARHLISLARIPDMTSIRQGADTLDIGAGVTMTKLAASEIVTSGFPALKAGAMSLGNHLIRNRATIGGNICNASPAGDTLPSLLAYDAKVLLDSSKETRIVRIADFFKGPGKTDIRDDEILTGLRLPVPGPGCGAAYIQLGKRKSSEINIVNVASFVKTDQKTGTIVSARIALGSVAATPVRAFNAEAVLADRVIDDNLLYKAAETARQLDCSPIDDFRGTAEYRRAMIGVLTRRTLEAACDLALGN